MSGATWHFRPWDRAGGGLRGYCHTSSKLQRQDRVKGVEKKDCPPMTWKTPVLGLTSGKRLGHVAHR